MAPTIGESIRSFQMLFRNGNIDSFALDAELLASFVLEKSRGQLHAMWDMLISDGHLTMLNALVLRRLQGEPIAYIVGHKDFWKDRFITTEKTLLPRPDSEAIIELTLRLFPKKNASMLFMDLGIGSGCLAISLLKEYQNSRAIGVDICPCAIKLSRLNCELHGVANRLLLVMQSWSKAMHLPKKVDCIICNPPYISSRDVYDLGVRYHEPVKALTGGLSSLEKFFEVMRMAQGMLKRDGVLIFEIGHMQNLAQISRQYKFIQVGQCKDLGGKKRAVALGILNRSDRQEH